jgi:hypothetical protein
MRRSSVIVAALLLLAVFGVAGQINKPALVIRANVEGADISLNGIPLGKTSPNFAILLDSGAYALKVSKSGYSEFSTLVTLPPESLVVNVTLMPIFSPPPPPPPASGKGAFDAKTVRQGGGDTLRSMALGQGRLVAVGNGMFTIYSNEGQRWLNAPKFPVSGNFIAVRWVKDRFLAAGDYGILYSSTDGIVWTKQNSGTTKNLGPMVWAGGRFVMVGQSGSIFVSPDGIKWTALPVTISNNLLNIAFEGSMMVVTGTTGLIMYSSDAGVSWNRVTTGLSDHMFGLAAGRPGFVVGGSGQNAPILFSEDGKRWLVVYKSKTAQTFGAVYWDGDKFIVGGSYGALLVSENGQDWREVPALENAKHAVGFAEVAGTLVLSQHDGTILNLSWNPGASGSGSSGAGGSGSAPTTTTTLAPKPPSSGGSYKTVTLLDEDFENNGLMGPLPAGWLRRDNKNPSNSSAWEGVQDGRNAHSGNWFASMTFGTAKAMITPALELADGGSATLSFWARNRDPKVRTNLTILLSHGGTAQGDFRYELGRIRGVPDSYQKFTYAIGPEHAGETLRIMFLGDEPEEGQIIHVDDVQVTARVPEGQVSSGGGKSVTVIDEDFENKAPPGQLPPGWLSRDNKNPFATAAWDCVIDNRNAHSGIQFTMASGTDKGLITPAIAIPSGGSATVTFWLRNRNPTYGGNLDVLLSYGGSEQRDFTDMLGKIARAPDAYQKFSFDIGALYAGRTVRLMFYASGYEQGQILQIDDVQVIAKGGAGGSSGGGSGSGSGSGGPGSGSGGSGAPVQFVEVVALEQGFEGLRVPDGIPAGWLARNNKDFNDRAAWEIYPEGGKSHTGSQYARTAFASDKVLITPPISIPEGGSGTVSFWARSEDANALENLSVLLSSSGTDQKDFTTLLGLAQKVPNRYQNYSFEIGPQFGGKTLRLQFRVADPGAHYILDLDDVKVTLKVPSGSGKDGSSGSSGGQGFGSFGDSDGTPGAPVRLTFSTSYAGKIARLKTNEEEPDVANRPGMSYYQFYMPTRGKIRIEVSAVSGKKSDLPNADLDFELFVPGRLWLERYTHYTGDTGIPEIELDRSGDWYLRVLNNDFGKLSYSIRVDLR